MLFAENQPSFSESDPQSAPPQGGLECRVFPRHSCGVDITCQPVAARDDEDPVWAGSIKDVSLGGIGLLLPRRFERGAGLAVQIAAADGCPGDTYLARVIHVRKVDGDKWLHGCEFISKLSDDELQRLVAAKQALNGSPPQPNVRSATRHRASAQANWCTPGTLEKKRHGSVHDISSLGVAIVSSKPISLGTVLDLELWKENAAFVQAQGRVVNVLRRADGDWNIGCALIEELRTDDLLPLHAESRRARLPEVWQSYPCAIEVISMPGGLTSKYASQARVTNVAPGAVGLATPQYFGNGAVLKLQLPNATGRGTFLLRVVLVSQNTSSGWSLGCEFASQLDEDTLKTLLG